VLIPEGYAQFNFKFSGIDLPYGAEFTIGSSIPDGILPLNAAIHATEAFTDSASMSQLDNDLHFVGVHVKYGPNDVGPSADYATDVAGDAGATGQSPQVCLLVQKQTTDGGHAGRGRFYLPGPVSSVLDGDGTLHSGFRSALQGSLDAFLDSMSDDDYVPVVLHGAGSPLTDPSPIVGLTLDARVATQRRRMRR
jgi:hypothetical protein